MDKEYFTNIINYNEKSDNKVKEQKDIAGNKDYINIEIDKYKPSISSSKIIGTYVKEQD